MHYLDLQRASAGSGKTYTLAKKYLWYLLTITTQGSPVRLRTRAELADSARHILAITFTNKATNEMQMRIVARLFDLAFGVMEEDEEGNQKPGTPDYQQEFCKELGISAEELSAACKTALSMLLENYSDFNVSTIDSFFQQVLRTFAYESDINEGYQVELDSEYLSKQSVDATLEEIDSNRPGSDTTFWVRTLVDRTEKGKWNIFQRSGDSKQANPYRDLVKSLCKLDNEEYRMIRREVERYFEEDHNFVKLYRDLYEKHERGVRNLHRQMTQIARELYKSMTDELRQASTRSAIGKFAVTYKNVLGTKWDNMPDKETLPLLEAINTSKTLKKWLDQHPAETNELLPIAERLGEAYAEWRSALGNKEFLHWRLYAANLPFLGLFHTANEKRREFLDENNAVELGETSSLLSGIIGKDDTPFIYERLGTKLNHFLIDEFQDTSRMQWHNLKPLVTESISRGHQNLIIGDAKQSIYRFRNADPSLISEIVPAEFADTIRFFGEDPKENRNYRSSRKIVAFNNSLFEYLALRLDEINSQKEGERMMISPLYGNVVQQPVISKKRPKPEGYVELHLQDSSKAASDAYAIERLPYLVQSLRARGYKQKDIAVLVSTNDQGGSVIDRFVAYNNELPEGETEIRFVSEQSLKVASSPAVRIVTSVLENVARGENPEIRTGEQRRKYGVGSWADMMATFRFFSMNRDESESISDRLDAFINGEADLSVLGDMLASMQSLALPAIVEAVTARFVPTEMRSRDAIYLAAFQDLVLEYCDGHPTDIGTFLKWWERRSLSASVASPEDTDAVQVITVHKSKGLEYKCVILPFANWDFADSVSSGKVEWRWVKPQLIAHPEIELPPYLPIDVDAGVKGTSHEHLLNEYFDKVRLDNINSAYVAFTRPRTELYVFATTKGTHIGSYIKEYLTSVIGNNVEVGDIARLHADELQYDPTEGENVEIYRIGRYPEQAYPDNNGKSNGHSPILISDYSSLVSPSFLKYQNSDSNVAEEEDLDPRSEGILKHAVLEYTITADDLDNAIKRLCNTGHMSEQIGAQIKVVLAKSLNDTRVKRWFDGSARVITERALVGNGMVHRPDRIMIYPDGSAEIVDYKFGRKLDTNDTDDNGANKYQKQVRRYMRNLISTGEVKSVKGYLWYLNEDIVEEVKL